MCHSPIGSRKRPEVKEAIIPWLKSWPYHRFVTLTFNDARYLPASGDRSAHVPKLRERLKNWDARMNHAILGRHWATSPDRMFCFYFPEKIDTNPHWHGAIRFFADDLAELERQAKLFDSYAAVWWSKLVPSGTVDIQPIYSVDGLLPYLVKAQWDVLNFDNLILPDAFCRGG